MVWKLLQTKKHNFIINTRVAGNDRNLWIVDFKIMMNGKDFNIRFGLPTGNEKTKSCFTLNVVAKHLETEKSLSRCCQPNNSQQKAHEKIMWFNHGLGVVRTRLAKSKDRFFYNHQILPAEGTGCRISIATTLWNETDPGESIHINTSSLTWNHANSERICYETTISGDFCSHHKSPFCFCWINWHHQTFQVPEMEVLTYISCM